MTTPWTATVWDPDTENHSIRSLYGLHPGIKSFGNGFYGGSRITLNRGIDAIVRYILLKGLLILRLPSYFDLKIVPGLSTCHKGETVTTIQEREKNFESASAFLGPLMIIR